MNNQTLKNKQTKKTTKNKLSKQLEQEQNHRNVDHTDCYEWGGGRRKGTGNKKHKWQVQNRQGEVKNSIGNVEAKELICMTHGHELRRQCWWEGCEGWRRIKERKLDNCNSIINNIYFKKKKKTKSTL